MAFPDLTPQSELSLHRSATVASAPAMPWFETISFLLMILITYNS